MNLVATQQVALDNSLVAPEKRLKIKKCNAKIAFSKLQREETYQVTLDALRLSPCYPAFLITAKVPEIYMHQFWTPIKYVLEFSTKTLLHHLQKKNWLHSFMNLAILASVIRYLQFILIKCTSLGEYLLQSSIDFMYQADNREISSARKEHMPYPRFTKVIINHFISKDKTISMRNWINLHTIHDDLQLDIKDSKAYKTYYDFAIGKVPPMKARKYKKVASPSRKLSLVKEAEPVKKAKRVKRHAKKSTSASTAGVVIRDTPGVSVSKKKAPAKADRSKGIEILFDVALSEAAQLKEAIKRSQKDFHVSQATGSGDGTDFESGVPNEQQRKTSDTDEETGTKSGVPDVPKYQSESDDESWGNSEDDNDDINDDDEDDDNVNDDDSENEDDDGNDAHDSKRTDSDDDDENPSFTLKDYDEEEHDEEYESDDDNENVFEEEDDDLYKDVDVRSLGAEHEKERKGDKEMTDADQNVSQEKSYEQVVEDAHVTLTSSQKTESSKQSSSVSSDFASKFLILDNVPLVVDEVAYMMNVKNRQEESSTQAPSLFTVPETAIPKTSTAHATTVPPNISMITPLLQLTTPSPAPTTIPTTTSIPAQPDFLPCLDLIKESLPWKRSCLSSNKLTILHNSSNLKLYIDVVEKSVKDIIKDEVKSLLPQILPKEVSDFATPVIQKFELKKILLDKIEKSKSYQGAPEHRELYDGLVKSYNLNKDLFSSYGNVYSLKRDHEDKNKDEDPFAGSDRGLKKRKTSKDAEPPKGSKSKESKTSSSKGTKSQP
ncbi:hypothetical protein Tco_0933098 [Tanacetum coccineum]